MYETGVGVYHTQADADRKKRAMRGQLYSRAIRSLSRTDPEAASKLFDKVEKQGIFEKREDLSGKVKLFADGKRTPTSAERRQIFKGGGVVINLDTNSTAKGGPTSPMVVIPDLPKDATKEQIAQHQVIRERATAYAERVAKLYKEKIGAELTPRVVTRSQNKRGRTGTVHTEPYSVRDADAVKYFNSHPTAADSLRRLRPRHWRQFPARN